MGKILLLGFVSGLPWLFIASMVSLWLKEEGLSRTGIGLFGLIFSVYAVNFLWAPVIDGVRIPFFGKFGRRRGWILAMQGVIVCMLLAIAALPQAQGNLWILAALLFAVALASATQDVAIDALRIEMIGEGEPEKIGAGSAMATSGWWLGFGGGKALAFPLVDWFQDAGIARAWQAGYFSMTVIVVVSVVLLLVFVRESPTVKGFPPPTPPIGDGGGVNLVSSEMGGRVKKIGGVNLLRGVVRVFGLYRDPVVSFAGRYGVRLALMLLFFVFFFKIGEAFLGRMSLVFYKEIGFSKSQIGLLSGGLGTVTVCVFAVLGSFINARYGLFRGIVLGGCAMAATNFLFALLAHYPEQWLFTVAVVADQFTTAVSTVAFVAFLSQLCDRAHTATHYAALASLGNLSRTTLAAASGALVDGLGGNWSLFFVLTVLMVTPSLFVLAAARRRLRPVMTGATTRLL